MATNIKHELYDGLLIMDHFDDCIVGVVKGIDSENKVCYSYQKVIHKLIREDEMEEMDAIEYFEYNMMGAYVGETTPCFLFTEDD
jgi:hypothetical protein